MTGIPEAFDEIADRYDTTGAQFSAPIAGKVVELADLIDGEKVLDAGAGNGAVLVRAARKVGPSGHVTGIDLSPRMLARARAEAVEHGLANVTVRPGDAEDPPMARGSLDAVLASLVLYLLPGWPGALAAWRTLLVPGGVCVFSWGTGQDERWQPVLEVIQAHEDSGGGPGFLSLLDRLPGPEGMEAVLARLGYQHVTTVTETVTTVYDSPEQFWDASASQGPWVTWRHVPVVRLGQARADAFRLLEPMRDCDGKLTRRTRIAYAKAFA